MYDLDIIDDLAIDHDSSIQDVLMCWGTPSNGNDDGIIAAEDANDPDFIISTWKDLVEDSHSSLVLHDDDGPTCSESSSSSSSWDLNSPMGRQVALEELTTKYPRFIPPPLPYIPIRRSLRPLCTFVNFMGTRQGTVNPGTTTLAGKRKKNTASIEAYPLEIPSSSCSLPPTKRRQVTPTSPWTTVVPLVSPSLSPKTSHKLMKLTSMPSSFSSQQMEKRVVLPSSDVICDYGIRRYSWCQSSTSSSDDDDYKDDTDTDTTFSPHRRRMGDTSITP